MGLAQSPQGSSGRGSFVVSKPKLNPQSDTNKVYEKAIQSLTQRLEVTRAVLGKIHPEVASAHAEIANAYSCMRKFKDAIHHMMDCINIYISVYGSNHDAVIRAQMELANLYRISQEDKQALTCYFQALVSLKERPSGAEEDLISVHNAIATLYIDMGRISDAIQQYDQSYELLKKTVGESHPRTLMITSIILSLQKQIK
eukprot:TRINITY_DN9082_c0_g1_i3.p1 TRINITY_DN9082_c0_g1~~TRINITY_DN9082_c0_g1_i3.p1  ORF type:complete len:200 (+),score=37.04 TRINITY_DN9082_c0_g1_i3:173-772(+)